MRSLFGGIRSWWGSAQRRDGNDNTVLQALNARLAQAEQDRDGYRKSYLKLESEVGQARADAQGYRESYLKLESEVGQARAEAEGYKGAYQHASTEQSRFRCLLREAPAPVGRPRQFVFLHIQKTGGISLLEFFGQHFEWYRTLWVFSPAELESYAPTEIAHFDRVCGHFSARNLASVRPDAFLCTFLREPVDRVISCYWYFRSYRGQMRESIRHAVESARSKTFLEFLQDCTPEVRMHLANHQAHALAGDWAAPDDRPAADLLASALEALSRFDSIGLTEDIDASLTRLCQLTGWTPPSRLGRLNVTAQRQHVGDLSPAELEMVHELTAVDAAVYRAAKAQIAAVSGPVCVEGGLDPTAASESDRI